MVRFRWGFKVDWLKKNIQTWTALIFAVVVLYYLHPYYGIRHDSPLYLGQALLAMKPEIFKQDLFFAYGSQADFTILPSLLGWLCARWHPADAFLALTALALLMFLGASLLLTRQLFGPRWGYWAVLSLLIFPAVYGGLWIMSYAESFLTGRTLAEPVVLLVLWAYFRRHYAWASVLFLLAALVHPLQALGGLMVVWSHLVIQRRAWLHLLWLPALAVLASYAGVSHLAFLTARYDSEWFEWVKGPNQLTFLSNWSLVDWIFMATDVFLVSLWIRSGDEPRKGVACAALLAVAIGFVTSYVGYEVLQFVFLGGLQLWRVDWLLHWLAMASIPALLYVQWQKTGPKSIEFLSLITIVALGTQNRISPDMGKIVFVLIPLYWFWPRIQSRIGPGLVRALLFSMPFALMVAMLKFLQQANERYHASWHLGTPLTVHYMLLSNPAIGGLVVCGLLYLFYRWPRWQVLGAVLVLPALAFSLSIWDRRSEWTLELERSRGDASEFGLELEPNAKVFWSNELLAPWLVLRRPSYYSGQQTAGILFNRETAREVMKRNADLNALNSDLEHCKSQKKISNEAGDETCNVHGVAISRLCRVAKSDLDYVILDFQSDEPHAGEWHLKGRDILGKPINYYIYRCADLLKAEEPSKS